MFTQSSNQTGPRVLVWSSESPITYYHHIAKTGITSIVDLLNSSLEGFREGQNTLWAFMPTRQKEHGDFYIGSIRNPCNYYVSLWSYSSEHENSQLRKNMSNDPETDRFFNVTSNKTSADDKSKFHEFMNHTMGEIGICTGRFAYGYVSLGNNPTFLTKQLSHDDVSKIQSKLNAFNTSLIDCWVSTETLTDDMAVCLRMLERQLHVHVNWTNFDEAATHPKSNPSSHGPCKDYYNKELENLIVNKTDPIVFSKFGFDACCDAPSNLAAHITHNDFVRHSSDITVKGEDANVTW